jgi:SnoaL-like domain
MSPTQEEKNKALVLEAFDTLFNKRDYAAAERYWSPNYIQHSAHIAPGREGLFDLIKSLPATLKYESGPIVAEKDFVIVQGRFSGFGQPTNWIGHPSHRGRDSSRALGCHPGRGHKGPIKERKSHVWRYVSNVIPGVHNQRLLPSPRQTA